MPFFLAVTLPLLFTLATFLLDDDHFTFPFAHCIFSWMVWLAPFFFVSVAFVTFSAGSAQGRPMNFT